MQFVALHEINAASCYSKDTVITLDSLNTEHIEKMYKNRKIVFACTFIPSAVVGICTGFTLPFLTAVTIIAINETRISIKEKNIYSKYLSENIGKTPLPEPDYNCELNRYIKKIPD